MAETTTFHSIQLYETLERWERCHTAREEAVEVEQQLRRARDDADSAHQDALLAYHDARLDLEKAEQDLVRLFREEQAALQRVDEQIAARAKFIPTPTITPTGPGVLGQPADLPWPPTPTVLLKRVSNGEQVPLSDAAWYNPANGTLMPLIGRGGAG